MKALKIFIVCCIILNTGTSSAQKKKYGKQFLIGSEIGFTGALGGTGVFNADMRKDNNLKTSIFSFNKLYGFRTSLSYIGKKPFSSMLSVYGEYNISNFKKNYEIDMSETTVDSYNKIHSFKLYEIDFALRFIYFFGVRYDYPMYFDLGLRNNFQQKLEETNSVTNSLLNTENPDYNPATLLNPNYKNIFIGGGIYLRVINLGMRFYYGINNFNANNSYLISDGLYNNTSANPDFGTSYSEYSATNRFSVELKLEINFALFSAGRCDYSKNLFNPFSFGISPTYYWR